MGYVVEPETQTVCTEASYKEKLAERLAASGGKAKSGARKRKERKEQEAALDVDEQVKVYELRCKAVLLTYQLPDGYQPDEFFDGFEGLAIMAKAVRWSMCVERGQHLHAHVFVEFGAQLDRVPLSKFAVGELECNDAQPNACKGSGYRLSADRGHFYVACKYKNTFVAHRLQWKPCEDYTVKTQWVLDMWSKGKINTDKVVECMSFYKCLTPSAEQMVVRTRQVQARYARTEWRAAREKRLQEAIQPFRQYAIAEMFRAQFETERFRYMFLWIRGPSQVGKSRLVASWYKNPYWHEDGISWSSYDAMKHDVVIFDDCGAMNEYIVHHKVLFQSASVTKVNLSKTNCHELDVDTVEKPIVVLTNDEMPQDKWVKANCYYLEIDAPTWGPNPIEDDGIKRLKSADRSSSSSDPMWVSMDRETCADSCEGSRNKRARAGPRFVYPSA